MSWARVMCNLNLLWVEKVITPPQYPQNEEAYRYSDSRILVGGCYWWRLIALSINGLYHFISQEKAVRT